MTKQKKVLLGMSSLLVIFVLLILAAFSRNIVIPAYVNLFYAHGVSKNFDNSFNTINKELRNYGVYMQNSKATCHNGISDGGDVDYHYLSATVPCQRSESSNMIILSTVTMKQLTHSLVQSGWKLGMPRLPYLIPTAGSADKYGGLAYKFDGKTYCVFGYNNELNSHQVTEACERDVSFFGGHNG